MIPGPQPLSLDVVIAWVDRTVSRLPAESAPVLSVCGRVPAEAIYAAQPIPPADRALLDGFAVAASATIGAGSYSPLLLPLRVISAGDAMPAGTDAVIPLAHTSCFSIRARTRARVRVAALSRCCLEELTAAKRRGPAKRKGIMHEYRTRVGHTLSWLGAYAKASRASSERPAINFD